MHQLIDKKNKLVIYLLLLVILSTVTNKPLESKNINSILSNRIIVSGLSNQNNLQIEYKLHELLAKNIFFINQEDINYTISQYNLVESYIVKKIYPSTIVIEIKQTKFIARVPGKKQFLVGYNGKLIKNENTNKKLPYLFGELNSKKFLELKKIVENSKFKFENLRSIIFYPSYRWDILTNKGVLIKLPKDNTFKALTIAHKIISDDELKENKIIDLRISNFIVMSK
tara:strand:+ start:513 stop:1193 length:681 start_codon:yes stop_codon:yes gene_type:complete